MNDLPTDDGLTSAFEAFTQVSDESAAARIVDEHPRLRDPLVVHTVVRMMFEAHTSGNADAERQLYVRAALLCGPGWPQGPNIVDKVAMVWMALKNTPNDEVWLERAVQATRPVVVDETEGAHPDIYVRIHDLASNVLARAYRATGDEALLADALTTQRFAVDATPSTSVDLPRRLADMAGLQAQVYKATGDRTLLDEAVATQRSALEATPPTSSEMPDRLNNLANRLAELHKATGSQALLDEAVAMQRRAVALTPETSTELPAGLNNLATRLDDLYVATGDQAPLEEAVATQRRAVEASPATDDRLPTFLSNLAEYLADLYGATGDRTLLDEAVTTQRRAIAATPPKSTAFPEVVNCLALRLADLYDATGDQALLDEAVTTQRRAVDATSETSIFLPVRLNHLANRLGQLYKASADGRLLEEAVTTQRRAVALTPETSLELPVHLNNLADHLADLAAATGDQEVLDEAVTTQRRAVEITPPTNIEFPRHVIGLAFRLSVLSAATGERAHLDEAWSLMSGLDASRPGMSMSIAATRGGLARFRGDAKRAAAELESAYAAFDHEITRLRDRGDLRDLRDLAHRMDGLLGDLAATHVLNGSVERAVSLLEGSRVWLHVPAPQSIERSSYRPLPTAWVIPSRWDTAVVITLDGGISFHHTTVATTRDQIGSAVIAAINAARQQDLEAIDRTLASLLRMAGDVANGLPEESEMLVIPLGVAALLPYNAAQSRNGDFVVDKTAVTLAPSLAWAQYAHRSRPPGASHLGAFHSGTPPTLDLDLDRQTFTRLVGPNVLDQPTAEEVLEALNIQTTVGHFSCHGTYNHLKPLDSHLELETPLTLEAVLGHQPAPWLTNLSACETGIPDLEAAEQIISFPTGFLLGGAAHVIATLWPVGNTQATVVNDHIYRLTAEGTHPAKALQQGIRQLRDATRTRPFASSQRQPVADHDQTRHALSESDLDTGHPFWWAPFTHFGSPW